MDEMNKQQVFPTVQCPGSMEIPTRKEQEALARLRAIKDKVRELKNRLADLKEDASFIDKQETDAIEALLRDLKEQWDKWHKYREDAARERMIILGHEDPPK